MTFRIWGTENLAQPTQAGFDHVAAALPNGGYVVGFYASSSIYFQRYDGAGVKLGTPTLVAAANGVALDDIDIHAVGPDGNFVVAWAETANATNSVKVRLFNSDGMPVTSGPVTVGSFGGSERSDPPSIVGADDGGFVTVYNDPTNAAGVKLSVHAADGSVTRTLDIGTPEGRFGDVARIGANKYVVSYQTNAGIQHTVVDLAATTPVGPETGVGSGKFSEIVHRNDGGYAVIFSGGTNNMTVTAKVFDAAGNSTGSTVITTAGEISQDNFDATALKDGRIAVIYSERVLNPANPAGSPLDAGDIYLKIINADGTVSTALPLNSDAPTDGNSAQVTPSVTEMADGRLAVTWFDRYGPSRVLTNIVDPRIAPVAVNGTAKDDVYAGSEHDTNVLNGRGGNDKLIGGLGSDSMIGGTGTDVVSYERSSAGVIVSLVAGAVGAGGDARGDTYAEIESVMGSQHGDNLAGNEFGNSLLGLGGNDVLSGADGADAVYGGEGADALYGGDGNDHLAGENGNDVLEGGAGQDVLAGGAGDDTYYLDGSDTIQEAAGGGFDTVLANAASINLAAMANIEKIVFTGTGPATIVGTPDGNTLNGGGSNDVINAGGGNDVLNGGNGNDVLSGEADNDVLNGDSGLDILIGGTGNDTLNGGADNDLLNGDDGNDSLNGDAGNDTLDGGTGNDALNGGDGNDNLVGGLGDDALFGDTGNDTLIGGDGNDNLNGGVGDDQIWGGMGRDVLTGGVGKDVFVFDRKAHKTTNVDRVIDYKGKDDSIRLEDSAFSKLGRNKKAVPVKVNSKFFAFDKAKDGNDYLVYVKKTGKLYYDADGSGAKKAVEIATFVNKKAAGITAADFFLI